MNSKSIISRSIEGLKWNYLGAVARVALQLIAQIAIARLIGPKDFGSASAAIFVMTLANLLVELGLGSSLVQKNDITVDDLRLVLRHILLAMVTAGCSIYFFAETIAKFWGDPSVAPLVQSLVIAIFAQSGGIVALSLLKRELDFKWIQISQIGGYFTGYVVIGITVALLGGGPWSLVSAWIGQTIVTTILLYWKARHPLDIWRSITNAEKNVQTYGLRILLTNIANWTIENIDNFMVGKAFGTYVLGSYTVSYNLVRTPTNHLVTSIQQVLFPASARSKGSNDHGLAYLVVIWGISLLAFPIFLSVAVLSGTVVDALYGAKWIAASAILFPLALAMPFHAVMAVGGPMLWGRGEAGMEMRVQFVVAPVLVIVLWAMASMSPVAMAWGVTGVYVFRAIWIQIKVSTSMKISLVSVFLATIPGMMVGVVISGLLWGINAFWMIMNISSFPRMLLAGLLGLLLAVLVLRFVRKLLPSAIGRELSKRNDLPNIMRRLLGLA